MQTKLTIRLDQKLINRAKVHARQTGKSISRLVADYFAVLDTPTPNEVGDLPPITRELYGALADARVDESDYHDYLEKKHR